ncbi:MAG: zinc ribbon domain-containing protein [Eubacteriales bacterium]|nr:zinc ribbon domain-containing protein [Eubacteriales bacterium]
MFFMMGITEGRKDLEHNQVFVCSACGAYGRYIVFDTYTVLSVFFLPVLKWNRKYFVTTTCCHKTYSLDSDVGRSIEHGQDMEIRPEHLQKIFGGRYEGAKKRCAGCGYETEEDFEYCPKCGQRFQERK